MQILLAALFILTLGAPVLAQERYSSATLQSAAVATGNGTVMNVATFTSVGVQVTIATTATVAFEASQNGSTWAAVACVDITSTSSALASSATATGTYQCATAGMQYFRARISAWTAGAVTVTATATTAPLSKKGGGSGSGSMATDTLWDAAGDLAVGTGANTAARLAIGAEGTALIVSGGAVAWGTPSGSGMTHPQVMARASIGF